MAVFVSLSMLQGTVSTDEADAHHEAGVALHLQQCLNDAAREYDAALTRIPPTRPTDQERALVLRLAPDVFVNAREPFGLRDVAAIVHPTNRIVSYHLFWEDDVDFPDDSEPSDHEVLWVSYSEDGRVEEARSLFHGRVIAMSAQRAAQVNRTGSRPRFDTQWGKHGPMPDGWPELSIETEEADGDSGVPPGRPMTLLEYNRWSWLKLSTRGTRGRDHPLAVQHGWPSSFHGDFAAFTSFSRKVDVLELLNRRALILVSRWNSGTLARRLLFYNFRPKLEWPEDR